MRVSRHIRMVWWVLIHTHDNDGERQNDSSVERVSETIKFVVNPQTRSEFLVRELDGKNLYAEKANWKVVERGGEYVIYLLYGESERVSTT